MANGIQGSVSPKPAVAPAAMPPAQPVAPGMAPGMMAQPGATTPKKSILKKWWLWAIIAGVLVIVALLTWFMLAGD